jgi:hypothetical protein
MNSSRRRKALAVAYASGRDTALRLLHNIIHVHLIRFHSLVFLETQYKRMSTHPYEHTQSHSTPINTSEILTRLNLEIYEVGHQECLAVDRDVASH